MTTIAENVEAGQVSIRDARSDEFDDVARLILESYAEYENNLPHSVWETAVAEWADVRGRADESELIVAAAGRRLVGAVTFYPDATRSRTESWPRGWAAIRTFCVLPEARRNGIGRLLTEECLRRARRHGAPTVALKTMPFLVPARALYERMGFVRDPSMDHGWTGDGSVPAGEGGAPALAYRYDFES